MRQSTSYFKYNELQIPRGFILCELFNLLLYKKKKPMIYRVLLSILGFVGIKCY